MKTPSPEKCDFNNNYILDILLWSSIIIYLLFTIKVLLFKHITPFDLFSANRFYLRAVNLVPLKTINAYLSAGLTSNGAYMENVLGNILLFMPMGLLLRLFRVKQSFAVTVIIVCFSSFVIELTQFVLSLGSADVDDVILNTLGGFLGAFIFALLKLFIKCRAKIRVLVTVTALICAVIVLAVVGVGLV
jgi:glycopeptide antibiotics resistance protein